MTSRAACSPKPSPARRAVAHFIRRIGPDNIHEGDVYITNDPWEGTGHLHDITMVTPSFHKGALVGFFACTAHIATSRS